MLTTSRVVTRAYNLIKNGLYEIHEDKIWSNYKKRYLKPTLRKNGYLALILSDKNGEFNILLHQLIAINKFGLYTELTVNHIDGNKLNNNPRNIELLSMRDNLLHAIRIGIKKSKSGSDSKISNLTHQDIIKIFNLNKRGKNQAEISKLFNINQSSVSRILNGKRYTKETEGLRQ